MTKEGARSRDDASLFDSPAWHSALATGLGARVVSIEAGGASVPWTLVSRGPVTAAFPRFPVGLEPGDEGVLVDVDAARRALSRHGVDLVRMSAPAAVLSGRTPTARIDAKLPETVLDSLQDWRAERVHASVRRKFRQAESRGLRMEPVDVADGETLHALYRRAVDRQRGTARYPREYFDALCRASRSSDMLSIGKALTPAGEIAGFVATGHAGPSTYYLHGGYDDRHAALRPGYFAMRWAIESARDRGSSRFNFLVSPIDQPALRAYKESFGATTAERWHWQHALSVKGRLAIAALALAGAARSALPRRAAKAAAKEADE